MFIREINVHYTGFISEGVVTLQAIFCVAVILNKLHCKKVVGKWSVSGRYAVGMQSVCGR